MLRLRRPELIFWLAVLLSSLAPAGVHGAENVTLQLSNGDRISGALILHSTNRVVLSNSWNARLSVPLNRIVSGLPKREGEVISDATELVVYEAAKPLTAAVQTTNDGPWKGEAQLGLDLMFGARDRRGLYGRFKLGYQKPYESDPKKFFRNVFDYSIDYATTESFRTRSDGTTVSTMETTSDRMRASNKTSFDLAGPWYVYNLVGGGFDHVLRINAQYEAGPGVGYHVIEEKHLTLNLEFGLNYQAQYRSDGTDVQDVYYRLGQELTWKLSDKLSVVERLEYFPRINFDGHRMRFETTLKYELWKNISLNLTLLDLFDTHPAEDVDENELQVRSSLGLKF
ncbi:MAG TPA: DUF481 domain-containing protein [Verrucomicrobiae bacterium]|nr:DUF481 domain-containing protein [Verrucomicrobiae bacterium]